MKEIISSLRDKREYLHSLKINDIIEYLDKVGKKLNVKELASFMERDNLKTMLDIALRGNCNVLDEFIELKDGRLYHAQPRGLAVHWIAGNVPTLGIYSLIQAILTKNVSLIKASSHTKDELGQLLSKFSEVDTDKIRGSEFAETFKMIYFDSNDNEKNREISLAADIRIAWGGYEAVNSIINYEKNIFCEDIIYGPKYSYAVIGENNINKESARKLAFDISMFDQSACSSPHTVFVEGDSLKFAEILSKEMENVTRLMIPKGETEPSKKMDILSLRAEYLMRGKVFASKNTDWTVLHSEEKGLAAPCFSRVVFVRPIQNLKYLNSRHQQTVGLAMENKEERKKFIDDLTFYGVDRCPELGSMTLFDSPWDGMFTLDRMVRWVTTWK